MLAAIHSSLAMLCGSSSRFSCEGAVRAVRREKTRLWRTTRLAMMSSVVLGPRCHHPVVASSAEAVRRRRNNARKYSTAIGACQIAVRFRDCHRLRDVGSCEPGTIGATCGSIPPTVAPVKIDNNLMS